MTVVLTSTLTVALSGFVAGRKKLLGRMKYFYLTTVFNVNF